jgi:hypothetical protein
MKRIVGFEAAASAGIIASNHGKARVVPRPRKTSRRESRILVMIMMCPLSFA